MSLLLPRAARVSRRPSQRCAFWGYTLTILFAVSAGTLLARTPAPADARGTVPAPFAPGLERAYALAYHPPGPRPRYVYVASPGRVVRYRVGPDGEVIVGGYATSQASGRTPADLAR